MEKIELFRGPSAFRKIKQLNVNDIHINQWMTNTKVTCYILYVSGVPASFALLSKRDFDPLGKHDVPRVLDYVYTLPNHRRRGYACKLIHHIKKNNEFTTFCSNDESERLFFKCKCINHGLMNYNVMFRYP
ncbi:uncharacterized protein LOC126891694 [Diabrotica virgifera virgifera]|uniref:N-acetyltransferase domain-containing protein n=1 Tax=Diabrotica virgifera virgifera TaxID=50390 RepID=A0ABM5L395_DIAVI|nr:uncharacterized protein LOC126891694 [Diabrotica virgifera virgifera]